MKNQKRIITLQVKMTIKDAIRVKKMAKQMKITVSSLIEEILLLKLDEPITNV